MTDPYKILGVSPSATDDEIKKAYRALAKKYHPDSYVNTPFADMANEKMKEINEAYELIQKERSSGGASGTSYNGNYSGAYSKGDIYTRVRILIRQGRYSEADILLSRENAPNDPEWLYLTGVVYYHKGWLMEARENLEKACELAPGNNEYREALNMFATRSADSPYNTTQMTTGCSGCDICMGLMCAQMCCGGRGGCC